DYEAIKNKKIDISISNFLKMGSNIYDKNLTEISKIDLMNNYKWLFNQEQIELLNLHYLNFPLFLSGFFFLHNIFLPPIGVSFSKKKYLEVGEVEDKILMCEDFDLFIRMMLIKSKIGFNESTVFYRLSPNQMSKNILSLFVGLGFLAIRILEAIKIKNNFLFYKIISYLFDFFIKVRKKIHFKNFFWSNDYFIFNLKNHIFVFYYLLTLFQKELYNKNSYLEYQLKNEIKKQFFDSGFFYYLERNVGQDALNEVINLANIYFRTNAFEKFLNNFITE
ncbi:MAG: hypothetical protein ACPL1F_08090, partial [bacterium]